MELSSSNIKKFVIFPQKKAFLIFQETKTWKEFLVFQETELQETETPKKLLIFHEEELSELEKLKEPIPKKFLIFLVASLKNL